MTTLRELWTKASIAVRALEELSQSMEDGGLTDEASEVKAMSERVSQIWSDFLSQEVRP